MPSKHNADTESNSSKGSDTVEVSLRYVHKKIGRVLELFIILQFVTGAFVFFGGIFLLLWAVVPAASLKAGSYMLLAFYVIGRALLGFVGYYTDNFCLLFTYGVLLVATFVVRTIVTLVRLKISAGPGEEELPIPPLLQACPGALSTSVELICSLLECSQAFCSFYLCWIISKMASAEKSFEESRLNAAADIAKYLSQQETKRKEELKLKEDDQNEEDTNTNETKQTMGTETQSDDKTRRNSKTELNKAQMPLKSILHQPTQSHPPQLSDQEEIDYFREYRKYPHVSHPRPTQLAYQNQSFKECQNEDKQEVQQPFKQESEEEHIEEDPDQIVQDYNNNRPPMPMQMAPLDYNYYQNGNVERLNSRTAEIPNYPQYERPYFMEPPMSRNALAMGFPIRAAPPPIPMSQMMTPSPVSRALSPTPPSELNFSSPSSPLMYEQRMYNDYGTATNDQPFHHQRAIYP